MAGNSTQTVAIVGTGMVAKAHLQSVADLSGKIRLKGVLSRQSEKAEAFAADATALCGYAVGTYGDIDALAGDADVDWVILLTPPNARTEIVEKLAASGKSILVEKPVERNLNAARAIVETCEHAGVTLGVVFQHRVRAASRRLADLIAENALGRLAIVEVNVPWWREQSYYDEPGRGTYARDGGGVLISQAIHSLDLMLSLAGRVAEVQAMAHTTLLHTMEAEDYVTAAMRMENSAAGSLTASTASFPGDAESITLHFSKGVAHLQSGILSLRRHDGSEEEFGASATTGGGADPMAFTHEWHRDIIENFADAFAAGKSPLVTGKTALDVHALIDALVESSTKKHAVTVPYPEYSQ